MNLKFYMQYDQIPRLKNSKILFGREFKIATVTKNSKTNKIVIFSRTTKYIWLKFWMEYKKDLDAYLYQNEKYLYCN